MFYASGAIDRADHLRKDAAAILTLRASSQTRLVPVSDSRSLIALEPDSAAALFLPADAITTDTHPEVFLGMSGDIQYFAVDISALSETEQNAILKLASDRHGKICGGEFHDLRRVGPLLPHDEGSLLAYARGLTFWNSHTLHCIRCGQKLTSSNAGHVRVCPACEHSAFPRTDPAVIMLVCDKSSAHGERCLLGRSPHFPAGVYSTLAGFVEPGESLEDAVQREVLEEASIHTTHVRYVASQPWPFPRSIMLGFQADATTTDIQCDPHELEDAKWFTREQIRSFGIWGDGGEGFKLPRTDSIAGLLIQRWLESAPGDSITTNS